MRLKAPYTRVAVLVLIAAGVSDAQTRTGEIEAARDAKTAELKPETVTTFERILLEVKERNILERLTYGFNGLRAKFGDMATSSGFALGPEFYREDLYDGNLRVSASAALSIRGWQKYQAIAVLPHLAGDRLAAGFEATRRDYRALEFYGVGPESSRNGRSTYRQEDTFVEGTAAFRPMRRVRVGGSVGGLWVDLGSGRRDEFASTDAIFSPSQAPGLDQQTSFLQPSVFGQFDYRDDPEGPKSGGNYATEYTWYRDQALDAFSFRRWDVDLQQYVPFFNKTRRFALRARLSTTEPVSGNQVPFYLLPRLGGPDDLRGFRPFRFTDRNALVYNAEYRWEIFSGLDGALFLDAGKVMPSRGHLNFSDLEVSTGFGLRFNARNRTFIRLDVGFSHEGALVWIKFNDPFLPRLFGTGTRQPLY